MSEGDETVKMRRAGAMVDTWNRLLDRCNLETGDYGLSSKTDKDTRCNQRMDVVERREGTFFRKTVPSGTP